MCDSFPKISIVTINMNGDQYLGTTMQSILSQEYPNLEYIVIDGGSQDTSLDIIKSFEDQLSFWVSEPDEGMYDALNKGFKRSTGDIMGWLNSDDMLHPNALFTLAEIFQKEEVEWVQGVHSWFDEKGRAYQVEKVRLKSKYNYLMRDYRHGFSPFVQQESTYWKRSLWERSGEYISTEYQIAGDFELWMRFFRYGELYLTNSLIGGFRFVGQGQFSMDNSKKYLEEADHIISNYSLSEEEQKVMAFLSTKSIVENIPYFRSKRIRKKESLLKGAGTINWDPIQKEFIIQ